jgi:hypothetical protein
VFTTPRVIVSAVEVLRRHERLIWALHSAWALALGIGVMWIGARNASFLRVTLFYVAFLWLTSLFVPALVDLPGSGTRWRGRLRLVINYFTKNFYQQLLFFLLPVYYSSATGWSANMAFVGLIAVSAVLSTLDVVYDQHVSVRRGLMAIFFAFNLFCCINVMLPALWSISNRWALPLSAGLATVAFSTIRYQWRDLRRFQVRVQIAAIGVALILVVALGRPLIPPAPLRVLHTEFGLGIDRRQFTVTQQVEALPTVEAGRIYGVTSISAPLGLHDKVGHTWFQDGRVVHQSPYYGLQGGRPDGFRLWTSAPISRVRPGSRLWIDVRTEAGQLIGRAELDADRDAGQQD